MSTRTGTVEFPGFGFCLGIGLALIGAGLFGWVGAGAGWLIGMLGGTALQTWSDRHPYI